MNEQLLSKHIRDKATKSGDEYGWRLSDIPEVLLDAKNNNLVNVGGQLQYIFSDATCELYWLCIESTSRKQDELWADWVNRAYSECIDQFNKLMEVTDFRKEANDGFDYLKGKLDESVDLSEHEAFILYFHQEELS